jgi:hypothetical protein
MVKMTTSRLMKTSVKLVEIKNYDL